MNRVKQRKFNNLYWTYTVITLCMLLVSTFDWRTVLALFIAATSLTFVIFDERGKVVFPVWRKRMSKQHYDYIYKINDWAEIRGLNRSDFLAMQLEKSREENAELTQAITKYELGNKDAIVEIKDAIGDIYVTLVVAFKLLKPIETVYYAFRSIVLWHSKDELETSWTCFSGLLRKMDNNLYETFYKRGKSR